MDDQSPHGGDNDHSAFQNITSVAEDNRTMAHEGNETIATSDKGDKSAADTFKVPDKITFQLPKSRRPELSKAETSETVKTAQKIHFEVNTEDEFKNSEQKVSTTTCSDSAERDNPQLDNPQISSQNALASSQTINTKYAFPAQQLSQGTIPYKEPAWSGPCDELYKFEVLKNGTLLEGVDLTTKPFYVFGRLPSCDITLEHPSLSRYHAVVQYCAQASEKHEQGWYLYDLDSTHGTWINKNKIRPKVYHRLRVGHIVKFGGSSRLYILQGPDTDAEEESELSITEIKQQREKQKREVEVLRLAEMEESERKLTEEEKRRELRGCSWGIDEEEVADETVENPFSTLDNEELYIDDPKKSLKGYFEREGYDPPEYELSEAGFGKYKCQVELPIDTPTGQPIIAEVVVSGKKKEAVVECALEACRMLDRHGLLRNATHESKKRKQKNWEDDDFYDSDEDTFLDRTGDIEKKRSMRMKKAGKMEDKAQTYESLVTQHKSVTFELEEIKAKLEKAKRDAELAEANDVDALDAYMMSIKSGAMDTKSKMKLKCRQLELKKEELRLRKLINIAKPASLPERKKSLPTSVKPLDQKGLPIIGKRKTVEPARKIARPLPLLHVEETGEFVEENDDDEEEMETGTAEPTRTDAGESVQPTGVVTPTTCTSTQNNPSGPSDRDTGTSPTDTVTQPVSLGPRKTDKTSTDNISHTIPVPIPHVKRKQKAKRTSPVDYDVDNPDYAVWLPPKGQSGDGKTHLNEKYGY